MFSPIKVASSIKVTSTYDLEKALVGISPVQHPEAYRLLTALRNIAVAEQEAGSIYEIAGNAVSNHTKDTKIAQLTAQVSRLQTKLADTETKLAESDARLQFVTKEAKFYRDRAERLQTILADVEAKLHKDREENAKRQRILQDVAELWQRRYFEKGNVS